MRFLAPVLIVGVAAALATTSAVGQRPDDQILPVEGEDLDGKKLKLLLAEG